MKSYLEIQVPIQKNASWFDELRRALSDIPVRWQDGFYHITMAFLNEAPEDVDLRPILEKHLDGAFAPTLTFDKLDVLATASGMFIIYLTTTYVPESFLEQVGSIRDDMKAVGCRILSDFMLHVTLGRVRKENVNLTSLKHLLDSVIVPPFTLSLTDVDYRVFRGRILYET